MKEGLKHHNFIIREISEEEQVLLIDQEIKMRDEITNFGDVVHLSEEGTDFFIANITRVFLSENLFPKY